MMQHGPLRKMNAAVWFARTSEIKRMGPYPDQVAASAALIGLDGHPVDGAYVWPEYVQKKKSPRRTG